MLSQFLQRSTGLGINGEDKLEELREGFTDHWRSRLVSCLTRFFEIPGGEGVQKDKKMMTFGKGLLVGHGRNLGSVWRFRHDCYR
ncbi:MAG: hypothetical protein CVU43_16400 [Chloroflexi bacterium HGW-Chloroflexi-5]|nr:MAG: hypothetical protein CVV47_15005 [Spirochaetae bacterium HGW-Spirochaetae-3]PKN98228.1 MAG: hypothetical protein CVU43_16400 [Chloroflexi bacterium HGW-Chloroflexi-5]